MNPTCFPPLTHQGSQGSLRASSKGLALLDLGRTVILQSDGLDGNEARGILGAETLKGVYASLLLTV